MRATAVTRHNRKPKSAAQRKREQRERDKVKGVEVSTLRLVGTDAAKLEEVLRIRGGIDGPYSLVEYVALVVRKDHAALTGQLEEAQRYPCRQCGKPLPGGCGGAFKGELECLHTPSAWKLAIPVAPG